MAFLEVPLDQGVAIIETEDLPGARPISVFGDSATAAAGAVQSSLASIENLAAQITSKLGAAKPDGPAEIELTFGIKASAELGALIIAKAQGEANFSVKLKWVRHKSPS
jgi:hypothetical protein